MLGRKLLCSGLTLGLSGVLLMAGTQAQAETAGKWYDSIAASGYLQTSYTGNLSSPHDGPAGGNSGAKINNTGRAFDTDSNGFNFNTFLLQISKPVSDSDHFGFTTRLRTGQDATTLNAGTGSSNSLFVQEAYLTYVIPAMTKLSIIGGKFVTPEGYEGVDSVNNAAFSEGLLFTFAEPITHTGLKANYVVSDKINTTVGLVNGWDVAGPDNNSAKTILFQVATTPTKTTSWSVQGLYGKELNDPTASQRLSLDTVGSIVLMSKLTLAAQGNWGQQTNDPGTSSGQGTTHWVGAGIWASFAETDKCTTTARFEVLSDENGANRFEGGNTTSGLGAPVNSGFSGSQTVKEFTLSQKHMLTTAMGVRGEYRHDWSNNNAYFTGAEGGAVTNQNTVSADWFVNF